MKIIFTQFSPFNYVKRTLLLFFLKKRFNFNKNIPTVCFVGCVMFVNVSIASSSLSVSKMTPLNFAESVIGRTVDNMASLFACGGIAGGATDVDDYDKDGICNSDDLDDDNDGISDVNESVKVADLRGQDLTIIVNGGAVAPSNISLVSTLPLDLSTGDTFWYAFYQSPFTKAVEIRFEDTSEGIKFTQVASAYIEENNVSYDFKNEVSSSYVVATSDTQRGYGVKLISLGSHDFISSAYIGETGLIGASLDKDTDNDGLVNRLDLDSDGDGCSDAIEGEGEHVNNHLVVSSISGGNTGGGFSGITGVNPVQTNLGNTVDTTVGSSSYGIPTVAGGGQRVGISQNKDTAIACDDTDNDGVNDYVDLDDDNDGILDVKENCIITPINIINGSTAWPGATQGAIVTINSSATNAAVTLRTVSSTEFFNVSNQTLVEYTDAVQIRASSDTNSIVITYSFSKAITTKEFGFFLEDLDRGNPSGQLVFLEVQQLLLILKFKRLLEMVQQEFLQSLY